MKKFRAVVRLKLDAVITVTVEAEDPEAACDQIELMVHKNKERIEMVNSAPPESMSCEVMKLEDANPNACFLEVVK